MARACPVLTKRPVPMVPPRAIICVMARLESTLGLGISFVKKVIFHQFLNLRPPLTSAKLIGRAATGAERVTRFMVEISWSPKGMVERRSHIDDTPGEGIWETNRRWLGKMRYACVCLRVREGRTRSRKMWSKRKEKSCTKTKRKEEQAHVRLSVSRLPTSCEEALSTHHSAGRSRLRAGSMR